MNSLKFSIITVCYNSEKYIEAAIRSVLAQTYPNIEYIIIDGNSSDNTRSIINKFEGKIHKVISEPDDGLYDAMNKGIKNATGDVIGFLNSDDLFINENVIQGISNAFYKVDTDCIYADLYYVSSENPENIVRHWKTSPYIYSNFKHGWHPPHPTFYVKKKIYDQFGCFNLKFKLASDFELMLRFLEKNRIKSYYFPKPIVKMRLGGATNNSIVNIFRQNVECYKAFKLNGIPVSIFYPLFRVIPKLIQFFKK